MPPAVPEKFPGIELLAHDLRTSLTVASMGVQMAMRRVAADEVPGQEWATAGLNATLAATDVAVARAQNLIDCIRDSRPGGA